MSSLRTIRRRIRSVENTKKITRAMEMVAAAKLHRFLDILQKTNPYADQIRRLLENLKQDYPKHSDPLFEQRENPKKSCFIVIASDTGLCGTYNSNLLQAARASIEQQGRDTSCVIPVGRMALAFFRRIGIEVVASFVEIRPSNYLERIGQILKLAKESFLSSEVDAVTTVHTHYQSLSFYRPVVEKFLPIEGNNTSLLFPSGGEDGAVERRVAAYSGRPEPAAREKGEGGRIGYIVEPNAERIFEALIPEFLHSELRRKVLESLVSEQVSRMTAMRQATDNAREMIEDLTLLRNKIRQASITKEIIEVVSGARALRR